MKYEIDEIVMWCVIILLAIFILFFVGSIIVSFIEWLI